MLHRALVAFIGFLALSAPLSAQTAPDSAQLGRLTFSSVVRAASPAVVNIYTKRVVMTQSPLFGDPVFRQFFGNQLGIPQERVQRSLGSGVIISAEGLVVTNFHVISNADQITVVLADRREYEAVLVGADERTDLAVLKIDIGDHKLPVLPMGDSDAIEVGDVVLAIGNPFGVGQTVTLGIVSALARTSVGISDYRSFIQTDAAINPGNSGGALIDANGLLIGVNTAIFSQSGGSVGIGFAIPASLVKAVVDDISHGGKVVRPWLGATGQGVTSDMYQELGLTHPVGVLVSQVRAGTPAARAGLQVGDVVLAVNDKEVEDAEAMRFRVATLAVGEKATLKVSRKGGEIVLNIDLVPAPEEPARDVTEIEGKNPFNGATVANINPALIEETGLDNAESGVVIMNVRQNSIARRLQFQPGDLILKVNDQPIPSVKRLNAVLTAKNDGWVLLMRRGDETKTIKVGR